jgi:hypothetical protein
MGLQPFYGKGPQPLLRAGSWAASGKKITLSGIPDCLNYCVICIMYAEFTNVAAGRMIKLDGPRIGDT